MRKIMISIVSFLIFNHAIAKTIDTIPEPEFVNEIYFFDRTNNNLIPLEKAKAEMKAKIKIMGGGSPALAIGGVRSGTRIIPGDASFIISVSASSMMDPAMSISLYRFESRKGKREATMTQYGGSGGQQNDGNTVQIKFKKVKDGTFEIIVVGKLEKGEYGFINLHSMGAGGGMATYAFGVD